MSTTERLNIPNTINWLNSMGLRDIARELGFLSAENEALRAQESALIKALAECRDAFPMPDPGAELESTWGQAMGDPESVPGYVKAQVDALRAQVEALTIENQALWNDRSTLQNQRDAFLQAGLRARHALVKERDALSECHTRPDGEIDADGARAVAEFNAVIAHIDSAVEGAKMVHPTPSPLTRPVYLVATGEVHEGQETYTRHDAPVPMADQEMLFTRPPEPLTRPAVPDHVSEAQAAVARNLEVYHRVADSRRAEAVHPDDAAIDCFAGEALKPKMAEGRAKGRSGWETCPPEALSWMLREHVEKGDPRDVALFCMMLWSMGARIAAAPQPEVQATVITKTLDRDGILGRKGDVVKATFPALADDEAQPTEAAQPVQYLQKSDQELLDRFIETTEDDESFDIGMPAVKRLADLGVVRNCGFGRYAVTMFGYWVHEHFGYRNPPLPLMTNSDRDAAQKAKLAAQKGGA